MSVNWSSLEVQLHQSKHAPKQPASKEGVDLESKLHREIMDYCDAQWPRWKYIHARMDKRSTIASGAADFVLFAPAKALGGSPRCFVIECKKKGGKLSPDQVAWHHEMKVLGWEVRTVYSMGEFLEVIK